MADTEPGRKTYQKYQYSITQLLELSAAAYLSFDLSKFSYEAARAGVVPSLIDCAMAPRKSSASYIKGGNLDGTAACDALTFPGDRAIQPWRQPDIPPPIERQKDEGFAKFLKKHSSPTHNRVTAGGRIVPMEPRSPPPFSLPTNDTKTDPTRPTYGQLQGSAEKNGSFPQSWLHENHQTFCWDNAVGPTVDEQFLQLDVDPSMGTEIGSQQKSIQPVRWPFQQQQIQRYHNSLANMPVGAPLAVQPVTAPVSQQPIQPQQGTTSCYQSKPMMNLGMDVPSIAQYGFGDTWPGYNQGYGAQHQMQDMMSTHQLLAAWEQHYHDLDQQLKNIDRHRAMHHLDPSIAQQRKVIVQQRSDAKDTVKEYHAMLGIRRRIDSSTESWNTSFNVDAPSYQPNPFVVKDRTAINQSTLANDTGAPVFERPTPHGQRRIIPIVPPKDRIAKGQACLQASNEKSPSKDGAGTEDWTVHCRRTPLSLASASHSSNNLLNGQVGQLSNSQKYSYLTDSQQSVSTSEATLQIAASTSDGAVAGHFTGEEEEQHTVDQRIINAVMNPIGVMTKVRLHGGHIIEIGGQGLKHSLNDLRDQPLSQTQSAYRSSSRAYDPSTPSKPENEAAIAFGRFPITSHLTGKENVSFTPQMGHQKAATDAFLSQFNAVEDKMSRMTGIETQSLLALSATRNASRGYSLGEWIGRDDLAGTFDHGIAREVKSARARLIAVEDYGSAQAEVPTSPHPLMNKGHSLTEVQNVHAAGSLPSNLDGTVEARQSVQAQLAAANRPKSPRSPRFLRRLGMGTGAWYGPSCREITEKAAGQSNSKRPGRSLFH